MAFVEFEEALDPNGLWRDYAYDLLLPAGVGLDPTPGAVAVSDVDTYDQPTTDDAIEIGRTIVPLTVSDGSAALRVVVYVRVKVESLPTPTAVTDTVRNLRLRYRTDQTNPSDQGSDRTMRLRIANR